MERPKRLLDLNLDRPRPRKALPSKRPTPKPPKNRLSTVMVEAKKKRIVMKMNFILRKWDELKK
eukprot:04385.XXX_189139_189330_1 [CDS] Oithona nana genome sequencing.